MTQLMERFPPGLWEGLSGDISGRKDMTERASHSSFAFLVFSLEALSIYSVVAATDSSPDSRIISGFCYPRI